MKTLSFKRGIFPPSRKDDTNFRAIFDIPPVTDAEYIFPLGQSLGCPCEPIVEIGDKVLKGQKIGDAKEYVSAPVHSSVSGEVIDIREVVMPNGLSSSAIVVKNDGKDEEDPSLNNLNDYRNLTKEEILKLVREAGIIGMGGAGFPTHVKLNPPEGKKIDYVIINGSECEPYLTNDHRVMLEHPMWVIEGLQILLHMYPEAQGIIGIEDNKMNAYELLKRYTEDISNIRVDLLEAKYPQGAEKQLIYASTKREVPSGGLPMDVGCLVINVETSVAVQRAVVRGRPVMSRNITLTGDIVNNPGNYKVNLGTSYQQLIDAVGGLIEEPYKLISGGPMMGVSLYTLDVPVIKTSSGILCFSEIIGGVPEESPCIRCGRCVDNCPMGLLPLDLNKYTINGELDLFRKYNGMDCIECGSCSFVCPAKRHLVQSIRSSRRYLMEKDREERQAKADCEVVD